MTTTTRTITMTTRVLGFLALLSICALPSAALAQTVGSITGSVFDQTGLPLKGIKIVAESPTQIGGKKTTYTNDEGFFRISGLIPGRFTVTASAPKLKTYIQKDVKVTINAESEINVVMEVETEVVEVVVKEKAPVVNTKDANVKETFDEEFINNIPVASRNYQGVQTLAAGVFDNGTGNPNIRGGTYFNNSVTVDGIDTTDPVTHTFGTNFNFDAMADVEVQTAAFGAENAGTTGGVTNIVTKSGSNKFEVDSSLTYTDQDLEFNKDLFDQGAQRSTHFNVNVGGPIVRDKLWYFVSTELIDTLSTLPKDPTGIFPDHPTRSAAGAKAFAKLTWQITPRNKLQIFSNNEFTEFNNLLQSYLVEPEAELRQYQQSNIVSAIWESLLRDNVFLRLQAAGEREFLDVGPQSCVWDPDNCANIAPSIDIASGVLRTNFDSLVKDYRRTALVNGDLEWFKDTKDFGNHDIKLGTRFKLIDNPSSETVPGDEILYTLGTTPFARTEVCANDPRQTEGGACRPGWLHTDVQGYTNVAFLQDAWKPTRYLTITPGVAIEASHTSDFQKKAVTDFLTGTPHISAVWDATHDGRTAIRASFNQYVDTGFLALARFANKQLFERTCFWDASSKDYNQQCSTQGGTDGYTVGLPQGPNAVDANGNPITEKLRPPRVWEYTVGVEREVVQGLSIGADVVYRKYVHQFEDIETNLIWNDGGTNLNSGGGYKDGRSHFVFDLETPDIAHRRYEALTARIAKKEGRLKILVTYTLSRNEGQQDFSYASSFLDNPKNAVYWYGYLDTDQRHIVKLQGSYQFLPWLSAGATYEFASGVPYNRWFFNSYYRGWYDLRAQRGYDPGDINDPTDDRQLRMPDLSELALQARANLKKFTGQQLELWGDIFNVLGLRTTTSVVQDDGPFWGQMLTRLPPTELRLGVRYRY